MKSNNYLVEVLIVFQVLWPSQQFFPYPYWAYDRKVYMFVILLNLCVSLYPGKIYFKQMSVFEQRNKILHRNPHLWHISYIFSFSCLDYDNTRIQFTSTHHSVYKCGFTTSTWPQKSIAENNNRIEDVFKVR